MTWVLGPHAVNEFRAGFNRMKYSERHSRAVVRRERRAIPASLTSDLKTYADMGGAGGGNAVVRDNTFQAYDNFSYQKGRHLHQGWGRMDVSSNTSTSSSPTFTARISSRPASRPGVQPRMGPGLFSPVFWLGYSSIPSRTLGAQRMDGHQPIGSFYVQDQIRVTTKVTADLRTAL